MFRLTTLTRITAVLGTAICAAVLAVPALAGVGGVSDAAGDATGGAPDLLGVQAEESGGVVKFTISSGAATLGSTHRYEIRIDSDNSSSTGSAGFDHVLVIDGSAREASLWRWSGSAFTRVNGSALPAGVGGPYWISTGLATLGGARQMSAYALSTDTSAQGSSDVTSRFSLDFGGGQAQQQRQSQPSQPSQQQQQLQQQQQQQQQQLQLQLQQQQSQPSNPGSLMPPPGLPQFVGDFSPGKLFSNPSQPSGPSQQSQQQQQQQQSPGGQSGPSGQLAQPSQPGAVPSGPNGSPSPRLNGARTRASLASAKLTVMTIKGRDYLTARMSFRGSPGSAIATTCRGSLGGRTLRLVAAKSNLLATCAAPIAKRDSGAVVISMRTTVDGKAFTKTFKSNLQPAA
jgi:hypothetical protein